MSRSVSVGIGRYYRAPYRAVAGRSVSRPYIGPIPTDRPAWGNRPTIEVETLPTDRPGRIGTSRPLPPRTR